MTGGARGSRTTPYGLRDRSVVSPDRAGARRAGAACGGAAPARRCASRDVARRPDRLRPRPRAAADGRQGTPPLAATAGGALRSAGHRLARAPTVRRRCGATVPSGGRSSAAAMPTAAGVGRRGRRRRHGDGAHAARDAACCRVARCLARGRGSPGGRPLPVDAALCTSCPRRTGERQPAGAAAARDSREEEHRVAELVPQVVLGDGPSYAARPGPGRRPPPAAAGGWPPARAGR